MFRGAFLLFVALQVVSAFHGLKFTHSLTFPLTDSDHRCYFVDTKIDDRVYIHFATREWSCNYDV